MPTRSGKQFSVAINNQQDEMQSEQMEQQLNQNQQIMPPYENSQLKMFNLMKQKKDESKQQIQISKDQIWFGDQFLSQDYDQDTAFDVMNKFIEKSFNFCRFINAKTLNIIEDCNIENIESIKNIYAPQLEKLKIYRTLVTNFKCLKNTKFDKLKDFCLTRSQNPQMDITRMKLASCQKIILQGNWCDQVSMQDLSQLVKIQPKYLKHLSITSEYRISQPKLFEKIFKERFANPNEKGAFTIETQKQKQYVY